MTFTDQGAGRGLLHIAPGVNASGNYPIRITAADNGDGGGEDAVLVDEFTLVISVEALNEPPVIAPIGPKVAVIGEKLAFDVRVNDKNEDPLNFVLANQPLARPTPTSVYGVARFEWTPGAGDVAGPPHSVKSP
jgi:hypothetical protein